VWQDFSPKTVNIVALVGSAVNKVLNAVNNQLKLLTDIPNKCQFLV